MPSFNQPTDIFKTDGTIGIAYGGDNESWTINLGVFVGSQSNVGIKSTFNDSALINNGNIFSGSTLGVDFLGNNSVITNNAGHSIAGRSIGIDVGGPHARALGGEQACRRAAEARAGAADPDCTIGEASS